MLSMTCFIKEDFAFLAKASSFASSEISYEHSDSETPITTN